MYCKLVNSIVSEKCGITSCMLYNQPTFTNVFQQFIKWIEHCVQEVQQQKVVSYHPGMYCFLRLVLFLYQSYCSVLVAHNGFGFDFLFLVAEVKRRRLDDTFSRANLYYADTLYDSRRVSGKHPT